MLGAAVLGKGVLRGAHRAPRRQLERAGGRRPRGNLDRASGREPGRVRREPPRASGTPPTLSTDRRARSRLRTDVMDAFRTVRYSRRSAARRRSRRTRRAAPRARFSAARRKERDVARGAGPPSTTDAPRGAFLRLPISRRPRRRRTISGWPWTLPRASSFGAGDGKRGTRGARAPSDAECEEGADGTSIQTLRSRGERIDRQKMPRHRPRSDRDAGAPRPRTERPLRSPRFPWFATSRSNLARTKDSKSFYTSKLKEREARRANLT